MNKLLTKIVGATLGLTMAIGVGVAVANSSKEVAPAQAADPTTTLTASNNAASWSDGGGTYLDVSLTNDGGANEPKFNASSDIRLYNKNYITVSAKSAYASSLTISAVTVNGKGSHNTNTQTLNYKADGTLVKSGASTITFPQKDAKSYDLSFSDVTSFNLYQSGSNNVQISSMVITYSIASAGQKYDITTTVTNGTYTGDTQIEENKTASITITPNTGYKLPSNSNNITVTNATLSSYDSTTGVVTLSNPTGAVSVSVTLPAATSYSISTNLTNLTKTAGPTSMYENGTAEITLAVSDSNTYALPSSVTVTNAVTHSYNSTTGVVTINGATSNVTITASAINKPAEKTETFDFTDSSLWDSSETDSHDDTVYKQTVDLITMKWESNNQSSKAGAAWNPGRIYQNHIVTISSLTGAGAVTSIKSVTFHTVKNGTSSTTSGANNATKTVLQPTQDAGSISSTVNNQDVIYTITGTVTAFKLQASAQTRWSTVEVVYMKDQSEVTLNSISATCGPVLVSQKAIPSIAFNPQNASNKNVTLEIVENTSDLAEISSDGKSVIGKGNGTARLKITPADTHASAITINVTVNSLPAIYGVEIGKKYALVAGDYELVGIDESTSTKYGSSTSYSGTPSEAFPVRAVNGLYARTVALQATINDETVYLSYNKSGNANSLDYTDSINRESSWIFAESDSKLTIRNVESYDRYLCSMADGSRFSCYQLINDKTMPEFIEIAEAKTDKQHVQDFVDLYMHMTDYDQGGTIGSTNGSGWCKDGQHSYYLTAKAGYNSIIHGNSDREDLWTNDSDFANAKARYEEWARINNDATPYDGYDDVHTPLHSVIVNPLASKTNNIVIIVVISSVVSVLSMGAYFLLRKRKEH